MGCFSSTTTQQQQNLSSNTSSAGYSNPNITNLQNTEAQQIQQQYNLANTPVYGNTQIAQNLNNLNQLTNSSINSLKSSLARSGGLAGGGQAQGITNLLENKGNQAFNFTSSIPMLNYQAQMQGLQAANSAATGLQGVSPRTSMNMGSSTGTSISQSNPSVFSDIGQVVGIAAGAMGMPSSAMTQPTPAATSALNGQIGQMQATPGAMGYNPGYNPGFDSSLGQGSDLDNFGQSALQSQYGQYQSNPYNPSASMLSQNPSFWQSN